eukprot:360121-Chlamydomonas_euryale.AAC.24
MENSFCLSLHLQVLSNWRVSLYERLAAHMRRSADATGALQRDQMLWRKQNGSRACNSTALAHAVGLCLPCGKHSSSQNPAVLTRCALTCRQGAHAGRAEPPALSPSAESATGPAQGACALGMPTFTSNAATAHVYACVCNPFLHSVELFSCLNGGRGSGRRRPVEFGRQSELPPGWPLPPSTEVWVCPSTSGAAPMSNQAREAPYQALAQRVLQEPWPRRVSPTCERLKV